MSELPIGRADARNGPFRPATIFIVVAVGLLAFLGLLILGAYAPDLRSGRNGGAHALSNAATGFGGIVQLARATGRKPQIVRNTLLLDGEALVVLTPEARTADLTPALARRGSKATLVVLPKWQTVRDQKNAGWVRIVGLLPEWEPEGVLAPGDRLDVSRRRGGGQPLMTVPLHAPEDMRFTAPQSVQTVGGKDLQPIVTDRTGGIVLAQLGTRPVFVLADPDLLANHGLADESQARAALAMLDFLNTTGAGTIVFDVTLNGLGRSPSPLRLAFDPPFLAATLAIAAALLLAGWQALFRFGDPRRPERAIAFGKAALIDNAAALVRRAGRQASLGARYAQMIRDQAVNAFGVPERLRNEAIDAYLDRLDRRPSFSELAKAAENARNAEEVRAAAAALHQWRGEN